MIVRIRKIDGTVTALPDDHRFVEICDDDGNVGCAIYKTDQGTVKVIYPEDAKDVAQYTSAFDVTFCKKSVRIKQEINDHRRTS